MDWGELFNFLGAGGGLVVLLRWITDLPFVRLRLRGKREEALRDMLDGDMEQIKELRNEISELQAQMLAHGECVALMVRCPTYDRCPARHLVQDYKRKYYYPLAGQPRVGQKGKRHPRDNPIGAGDAQRPAGQPP